MPKRLTGAMAAPANSHLVLILLMFEELRF
jgi:hypothetical protein